MSPDPSKPIAVAPNGDLWFAEQGANEIARVTSLGKIMAPVVTSVVATPGSGHFKAGQTIALTLDLSAVVTVSGGVPTLSLNDFGTAVYDAASSTPTAPVFDYTVAMVYSPNSTANGRTGKRPGTHGVPKRCPRNGGVPMYDDPPKLTDENVEAAEFFEENDHKLHIHYRYGGGWRVNKVVEESDIPILKRLHQFEAHKHQILSAIHVD